MMSFSEAVSTCFRKYLVFSGRARRPEYWWFVLFILLASLVLVAIDIAIFGIEGELQPLSDIFAVATLAPSFSAAWRRMHDVGRPGYYNFAPLLPVPLFGLVFLFPDTSSGLQFMIPAVVILMILLSIRVFVLLVSRSEAGPNRFGPEPGAELQVDGVFD